MKNVLTKIGCMISAMVWMVSNADATIIGVTGNSGFGTFTANTFYEVNTATGVSTLKGTVQNGVVPNQLAYNTEDQSYYFMDHAGTHLYHYEVGSGQQYDLGDMTLLGMPAGKTGSGGGDFYNGIYYYTPETGTESIYAVEFNESGHAVSSFSAFAPGNLNSYSSLFDGSAFAGLGDFGDIAIHTNGTMYGSSRMDNGGTYVSFWTIDLTDPELTMTMLSTNLTSVYQLSFDEDDNLWANTWGSAGDLVQLSLVDGSVLDTRTLPEGGDFFDLASTGVRSGELTVPEPAAMGLITLGGFFTLAIARFRRRHQDY